MDLNRNLKRFPELLGVGLEAGAAKSQSNLQELCENE